MKHCYEKFNIKLIDSCSPPYFFSYDTACFFRKLCFYIYDGPFNNYLFYRSGIPETGVDSFHAFV